MAFSPVRFVLVHYQASLTRLRRSSQKPHLWPTRAALRTQAARSNVSWKSGVSATFSISPYRMPLRSAYKVPTCTVYRRHRLLTSCRGRQVTYSSFRRCSSWWFPSRRLSLLQQLLCSDSTIRATTPGTTAIHPFSRRLCRSAPGPDSKHRARKADGSKHTCTQSPCSRRSSILAFEEPRRCRGRRGS